MDSVAYQCNKLQPCRQVQIAINFFFSRTRSSSAKVSTLAQTSHEANASNNT